MKMIFIAKWVISLQTESMHLRWEAGSFTLKIKLFGF